MAFRVNGKLKLKKAALLKRPAIRNISLLFYDHIDIAHQLVFV
jgi:hypothetical protein